MTASRPGNLANLQKAAAALERMMRNGQPVTFRGLAATAPVSLDFLYRSPALRQRVEQLRARQQSPAATAQQPGTRPGQPGNVVAALTGELAQLKRRHREQVAELQRALQTAHGENLMLRRRLGQRQQPASPDH